ncbi:MAG: outer membrane beta-barrel protein [Alphaproteobacteria bacterium]|nr:outer membrane beta-barrel protein [Alphaproteobacteria bacterium]
MKKVVALVIGSSLTFGIQADSEIAYNDSQNLATLDAPLSEDSVHEFSDGLYGGVGICLNHLSHDIKGIDPDTQNCTSIHDRKVNSFGGSLVMGYGKFMNKTLYLGGEVTLDIASNKSTNHQYLVKDDNNPHPYQAGVNGLVPSVAFRCGGRCYPMRALFYVKGGAALVRSKYQETDATLYRDNEQKMSKISPLIGVGMEKNICRNWNIRFEGDYKFQAKKTDKSIAKQTDAWFKTENRLKGGTIRLMTVRSF